MRAIRATRAIRAIRAIRATRAIRAIRAIRAVRAIRVYCLGFRLGRLRGMFHMFLRWILRGLFSGTLFRGFMAHPLEV